MTRKGTLQKLCSMVLLGPLAVLMGCGGSGSGGGPDDFGDGSGPAGGGPDFSGWGIAEASGFGRSGSLNTGDRQLDANLGVVDLALFDGYVYAGTWRMQGARVYRRPLGDNVWEDTQAPFESQGFTVTSLIAYQGNELPPGLYAGTWDENGLDVAYFDGVAWHTITHDGFGDPRFQAATSMAVYNGKIFIGVFRHRADGGAGVGQLVLNATGQWQFLPVAPDGFGDLTNTDATSMAVVSHAGSTYLCAGTENRQPDGNGTEIWCGLEQNGSFTWRQINADGFDFTPGADRNENSSLFAASDGSLYVGTENRYTGCEVWRYTGDYRTENDAGNWEKILDHGFQESEPGGESSELHDRTERHCRERGRDLVRNRKARSCQRGKRAAPAAPRPGGDP
ncbi:MAG: hypothetical protein AB1640_17875 [bacterium]